MHPASLRSAPPAPPRPAVVAPRASTQSPIAALDDDLLDEDDPLDLDGPAAAPAPAPAPPVAGVLAIGPLAPGQEQEIDLPVRIDVGGRALQVNVKLKVRLSG
jgi:hypothetical protein